MFFKMPRTSYNRLSKKKSTKRRGSTSTLTMAKYRPKTTAANRSLIKSNAYAIRTLKRLVGPPVLCDWQFGGTLFSDVDDTGAGNQTLNLAASSLMSPAGWLPRLRQDINVAESSSTRVLRCQLNLRYTLNGSNRTQMTVFVVTFRRQAANRDIPSMQSGDDYIQSVTQDMNVRLNPAVFKVHYARNVSMTTGAWLQKPYVNAQGTRLAPEPTTTFTKGQVNLKLNLNLRQPITTDSWKDMSVDQLSPQSRYYLLCFYNTQGTNSLAQSGARLDFDALYTTMNAT